MISTLVEVDSLSTRVSWGLIESQPRANRAHFTHSPRVLGCNTLTLRLILQHVLYNGFRVHRARVSSQNKKRSCSIPGFNLSGRCLSFFLCFNLHRLRRVLIEGISSVCYVNFLVFKLHWESYFTEFGCVVSVYTCLLHIKNYMIIFSRKMTHFWLEI